MRRGQFRSRPGSGVTSRASATAHERYVQRTYGIAPEMYRALLAYQVNRCWASHPGARHIATGAGKRLAVDHNHRTGEVRALLCSTCNQILGHFRDDPIALIRLALVLINPPSRAAFAALAGNPEPGWESIPDDLQFYIDEEML